LMEVGITVNGMKVTSHILHQIWLHIQGSKHQKYHKWNMNGTMQPGTVLIGKDWGQGFCPLVH
jgi:hypothetical protein